MNTQLLDEARKLNVDEQIELIEAFWDSIDVIILFVQSRTQALKASSYGGMEVEPSNKLPHATYEDARA